MTIKSSNRRQAFANLTRPPTLTPEEEEELERKQREEDKLRRQPTFHNEHKGKLEIEGLALSDFIRNKDFGRAKLLNCLQTGDHEWVHLLFYEAEKKMLKWMHEPFYGQSPWHIACMHGQTRVLKAMLQFSSINKVSKTSAGQSPLFMAIDSNRLDTVKWLIERKDVEGHDLHGLPKYNLDETTLDGRTPLWQAANRNFKEICEYLISKGANVLKTSNPGLVEKVVNTRKVRVGDVVLLMPHKDRCKCISVEGSEDLHTIKVGDFVQAKYKGSDKYYPAHVTKVHDCVPHLYDLEFKDGAVEENISRTQFYREAEKKDDEGEEEEVNRELIPGVDFDDGSQEYQRVIREDAKTRKAVVRLLSETTHSWRHPSKEVEVTCDKLKIMEWLGTLPSEAAKAQRHFALMEYLRKEEEKARKGARKKLKAVGKLAIGLTVGRDEKKYEGMV